MEVPAAAAVMMDPEAEFLASGKVMGNEWEAYKENVRPLKRGRNVELLNNALKSCAQPAIKKSLLETRRRMIEAIEEYMGEDPLQPWLQCIKWVQESFPSGGECSGLIAIYEQCVRTFWHDERYRDDLRYLKVWLEYADNCSDAEVIHQFLEANNIGQCHSVYYTSYALHMESKNKLRKADDIFNIGIARNARPLEKLEAAYKKFLVRSTMKKNISEEEPINSLVPTRSFGTVLAGTETARRPLPRHSDSAAGRPKLQKIDTNRPLCIYNDNKNGPSSAGIHQPEKPIGNDRTWQNLGRQSDRNKENTSAPTKWTKFKVPQKSGTRTAIPSAPIEVFVDDEAASSTDVEAAKGKASSFQLKEANSTNLKKETELLKENPLRNFPLNSLR